MSLSFEQPYFSQWLTDANLPVKGKFICSTNGRPFYYLSMQVVNRIKSTTLTRDFSQKIYVNNSPTNDDFYNGIQGLAVTLNFVSADELGFEFQKLNFMGLVYYYGSFDCYGEVSMINSMLYGHFNKGHLEILYTHGKIVLVNIYKQLSLIITVILNLFINLFLKLFINLSYLFINYL